MVGVLIGPHYFILCYTFRKRHERFNIWIFCMTDYNILFEFLLFYSSFCLSDYHTMPRFDIDPSIYIRSDITKQIIELGDIHYLGSGSFGKVSTCTTKNGTTVCNSLVDNKANEVLFANANKKCFSDGCLPERYAIKEINITTANQSEVKHEVKMLHKIRENCDDFLLCIRDYGYGLDQFKNIYPNKYYIILELLDEKDGWMELKKFMNLKRNQGNINDTKDVTVKLINKLCEGLLFLHNLKVVHLDIKPENVFCNVKDPNNVRIKYIDFGLSSEITSINCRPHQLVGTPIYLDRYAYRTGLSCPQSDYFSLGIMIIELIHRFRIDGRTNDLQRDIFLLIKNNGKGTLQNTIFKEYMDEIAYKCDFFNENPQKRFITRKQVTPAVTQGIPQSLRPAPTNINRAIPPPVIPSSPATNINRGNPPPGRPSTPATNITPANPPQSERPANHLPNDRIKNVQMNKLPIAQEQNPPLKPRAQNLPTQSPRAKNPDSNPDPYLPYKTPVISKTPGLEYNPLTRKNNQPPPNNNQPPPNNIQSPYLDGKAALKNIRDGNKPAQTPTPPKKLLPKFKIDITKDISENDRCNAESGDVINKTCIEVKNSGIGLTLTYNNTKYIDVSMPIILKKFENSKMEGVPVIQFITERNQYIYLGELISYTGSPTSEVTLTFTSDPDFPYTAPYTIFWSQTESADKFFILSDTKGGSRQSRSRQCRSRSHQCRSRSRQCRLRQNNKSCRRRRRTHRRIIR